jgi:hypothetical protein
MYYNALGLKTAPVHHHTQQLRDAKANELVLLQMMNEKHF